jgi:YD repeat-containing protein
LNQNGRPGAQITGATRIQISSLPKTRKNDIPENLMKIILTFLLIAASAVISFGQNINSTREGATYDRAGRMIAYTYQDGARDLYAYDSQWRMTSFTDRTGKVTQLLSTGPGERSGSGDSAIFPAAPIDSTLYTNYFLDTDHTLATWIVCGSLPKTSGCYGSGILGPFGKVGALIEGYPTTDQSTSTVTRYIYVVDVAAGTNQNAVTLYVYKKTDVITPSDDTVTVTLFNTVDLPLTGGAPALASMAANKKFLVIGTSRTDHAVQVQKNNFAITEIGGFSPPINVSAITANQYGYITVSFGSMNGSNGFVVLSPQGGTVATGGGYDFMAGTQQATLPSTFR